MKNRVIEAFRDRFGKQPALIVRAPGRVNLIGEHTDYNDGFVLPMAIERAVWLAFGPRDDGRVLAYSLEQSEPTEFALSRFKYEDTGWAEYVKGMTKMLQAAEYDLKGWEGVLTSDVPIGSGLSSSAALEMAVGVAFAARPRGCRMVRSRPLRKLPRSPRRRLRCSSSQPGRGSLPSLCPASIPWQSNGSASTCDSAGRRLWSGLCGRLTARVLGPPLLGRGSRARAASLRAHS